MHTQLVTVIAAADVPSIPISYCYNTAILHVCILVIKSADIHRKHARLASRTCLAILRHYVSLL